MNENENLVPKRRFKEFKNTGTWEQRKLGEVANFLNGRAYKQQELLESGKYRVLRVGNFNTNDKWYYSDLELEENKYANSGDLLYLWATNFGPEIWDEEKVIYHYHIWKLDLYSSEVDKQYMYTWLITDKEKIKQTTNGTTMVHVTKGNMEQREFQLPISIKEQKKIGSFFKQLDNTIALHQRKLEKSKALKSAYLSDMFPAEGDRKPKRRFAGFTDDWEQRKLKELTEVITKGTTPKDKSGKGSINFVKVENINKSSGEIDIKSKITENEHEGYLKRSQLKDGDILFSIAGTLGRTAIVKKELLPANTNQALAIIRLDEGDKNYITTFLNGRAAEDFIKKNPTVGAQPNLSLEQVGNLLIEIPSLEEQTKIGSFFKQLDDTIALHQRQLHNYKQLKKAMMQKIFNQELRFKDQDGNNYPEWKTTTLDKICTIKTGNMNVQDSVSDGKYTFFDRSETIKKLNEYSYDEEALIYPGEGSSFYPRYFKGKYALHQRAYSLSDFEEDCSARYVYHYLNTKNNHFLKTCVGTTVRSLRMTSFESCEVEIPSYLEQQEIADFLSAIEKRLENLEQTVELLKEQKKGLMQQMFV